MNRRRFLLTAAMAGLPLTAKARPPVVEWRGVALGAAASLKIAHPDPRRARRALAACAAEIARLEGVFSLYRESALRRLNAAGRLEHPPADLVALLSQAQAFAAMTDGAFDPTVQPLWELYAAHFSRPDAAPEGPGDGEIARTLATVGWRRMDVSATRLRLEPGTRVTLNGAAQGWITDRLVDLVRDAGLDEVLVDAGEIRGEGDWTTEHGRLTGALAVSSGDGTRFSPACHHLFDPRTGRSSQAARSVTVAAPTATLADLVSTAIAVGGAEMLGRITATGIRATVEA